MMTESELELINKSLPVGYRVKWIPADLEGPAEVVFKFPDCHLLQVSRGRRFFGLKRRWQTFAYIHEYWPLSAENVIYLHSVEHESVVRQALVKSGLDDKVTVIVD
jgi:hypothetical protein